MTELELMIDLHRPQPRQGPGSPADTRRALSLLDLNPETPLRVADIGCGSGASTLTLAQHLSGHFTAVDLFSEFLEELEQRARQAGLEQRISTVRASMEDLPFEEESFDLIWSEGAIYHLGFSAGVQQWARYLKPGGYLAVSEITWLTAERPAELDAFWQADYPEIDLASAKIQVLESQGYTPLGYFVLPPDSWLEQYYQPLQAAFPAFLQRHLHAPAAQALVQAHQEEIDMYRQYQAYYSYGFYLARKG